MYVAILSAGVEIGSHPSAISRKNFSKLCLKLVDSLTIFQHGFVRVRNLKIAALLMLYMVGFIRLGCLEICSFVCPFEFI
jgi:hypothetical protein